MTHPALSLDKPKLMAIVNVTPDSFSDGGLYYQSAQSQQRIDEVVSEGADIIDIGGESTRPGAALVGLQEELDRVIPAIEYAATTGLAVSTDTSRPELMLAAKKAGAHLINDVRALTRPGALAAAQQTGLPVCLMHMQGSPETMQDAPAYQDIFMQVNTFFNERINACVDVGIPKHLLWLDPGFGFGKTLEHNLQLMRSLSAFSALGCPLLIGVSRKSMIGHLLGRPVDKRLAGSLALAMAGLYQGAKILRVHDIAATRDMIDVFCALQHH